MTRWPNLFIVGAPRAGTTSLHEYLDQIPGIFMSPLKEPAFFSLDTEYTRYIKYSPTDEKKYLNLFEKVTDEKYVGESSTVYLSNPKTPERIFEKSPHARIIISLRDPVERAFSHYFHHFKIDLKSIQKSFDEQVRIELQRGTDFNQYDIRLEAGLYFDAIRRYMKIFGKDKVKILIFEEFIKNVTLTIRDILEFLEMNSAVDNFNNQIYNASFGPRGRISNIILRSEIIGKLATGLIPKPSRKFLKEKILLSKRKIKMSQKTRDLLINFYQDDVNKLQHFLGRKLPWPNFKN